MAKQALGIGTTADDGTGDGTVDYVVSPNLSTSPRTGTITITGDTSKTFKVTQSEGVPTLDINTKSLNLNAAAGSSAGFWASSNTTWMVESTADWLTTKNTSSSNGFGRINITANENPGTERSGKILVKVKNLPDHVIEVIQATK